MRRKTNVELANFCKEIFDCHKVLFASGGDMQPNTDEYLIELIANDPHQFSMKRIVRLREEIGKCLLSDNLGVLRRFTGIDEILSPEIVYTLSDDCGRIETMPDTCGLLMLSNNTKEVHIYLGDSKVFTVSDDALGGGTKILPFIPSNYSVWLSCPSIKTEYCISYKRGVTI